MERPDSGFFVFVVNMNEVLLFPICTLIWRVNNYVSRQRKTLNRKNKSFIIIMKYCNVLYNYFRVTFDLIIC